MKTPINLIAGLAGSVVLNIIHEVARKYINDAPHVNKVGEESLTKLTESAGLTAPTGKTRYAATLGADLAGNTLYYSGVGGGSSQNIWLKGLALGLSAGIGAIAIPAKVGLDDQPVARTLKTKILTITWYTIGGLTAAAIADLLKHKKSS